MDGEDRIKKWEVDTDNPQKILKVEVEGMTSEEVKSLVTEAGFNIEEKRKGFLGFGI